MTDKLADSLAFVGLCERVAREAGVSVLQVMTVITLAARYLEQQQAEREMQARATAPIGKGLH